MNGNMLSVVLLIGGLNLLATAQQPDTERTVPEGCDEQQIPRTACLAQFKPSSFSPLGQFLADHWWVMMNNTESGTAHGVRVNQSFDLEQLDDICSTMEDSMDCLERAEYTCFSSDQDSFTALLGLDYIVPRVDQLQHVYETVCAERNRCIIRLRLCYQDELLKEKQIDTQNPRHCQAVRRIQDCFAAAMEQDGKCRVVDEIAVQLKGLELARGYCDEHGCAALNQCRKTATPPRSVEDQTCYLYRDYIRCAANATKPLAQNRDPCPLYAFPQPGQAYHNLNGLASILSEACLVMGLTSFNSVYQCQDFEDCLNEMQAKDLFNNDISYLPNVCPMLQDFIGCAMKAADICQGVDQTKVQEFKKKGIHLAYEVQRLGCANANVFADSCPELQACNQTFHLRPHDNFGDMCKRVVWYEACATPAVKQCIRTLDEDTQTAVSVEEPHLEDLSPITHRLCKVTQSLSLTTDCHEFLDCAWSLIPPVELGWQLMNGQAWCQCVLALHLMSEHRGQQGWAVTFRGRWMGKRLEESEKRIVAVRKWEVIFRRRWMGKRLGESEKRIVAMRKWEVIFRRRWMGKRLGKSEKRIVSLRKWEVIFRRRWMG